MNTLKKLLLSLSIASMGFVAHVRADDAVEVIEAVEDASFVNQATDVVHDIIDDVQDLAHVAVDQAQDVAEDIVEDTRSLMGKYQNMVLRAVAKSFVEAGANYSNVLPTTELIQNNTDTKLAKIYVDLGKIVVNTALDELIPQDADAGTVQNVVEAAVPAIAGALTSKEIAANKYANYAAVLAQKAFSKGLFIKTEGLTQRAIQVTDFILSCVDAKKIPAFDAITATNVADYVSIHKGVAKLVTKQVMDAIVKKAVSDAQVTSKATREKALADFFQAVLVKPLCEAGVEHAFSK